MVPKRTVARISTNGNIQASASCLLRSRIEADGTVSSSMLIHTTARTPCALPTGGGVVSTVFQLLTGATSRSLSEPAVGRIPQRARAGAANIEPNRKCATISRASRRSGPQRNLAPIRAISKPRTSAATPARTYRPPP